MLKTEKSPLSKSSSFKKINISAIKVLKPCCLEVNFNTDFSNKFPNKLLAVLIKRESKNILYKYFKEWIKNK